MTWQKLIKSKLFLFLLLITLGTFSYFFAQELKDRYDIEREIRSLQGQIAKLEQGNTNLTNLIQYLKSPGYQEKELRSKLNLQRPGEHVVVLPQESTSSAIDLAIEGRTSEHEPNWRKWWNYFFSH
ncbi:MAG: hypothetical protein A2722_03465 [Candidatus Doudnabacteria bacterium RIFCSPHIGHO2_01_FULL_50_11]|uniref:Cell division protein FtsL n=1 Tax=Candidatus Doudnabacteria bacterium RIFCSPHIGHO2_01_FULL_50_11 TaxID=1817828 RepID=A0A1F5PJ73_9BACT|nr:MAG: hypothetical protein A2722_03465 [Candidatus Doudnabacteria bacterium RIFCSPHIGHO2_01_FULL_50_11]HLC44522.1 septum formation initiator family protein [Patescibacteria group bacterium]